MRMNCVPREESSVLSNYFPSDLKSNLIFVKGPRFAHFEENFRSHAMRMTSAMFSSFPSRLKINDFGFIAAVFDHKSIDWMYFD